ncbi:hypothetical protein GCM10022248_65370 [Nonomuraea soli]
MVADGAGEVGLVGEAEVGGEQGEAGFALLQAIEGATHAHAVAVVGEGDAERVGEGAAEAEGGDVEVIGEGEEAFGGGVAFD